VAKLHIIKTNGERSLVQNKIETFNGKKIEALYQAIQSQFTNIKDILQKD
jgi:hypothetical protein